MRAELLLSLQCDELDAGGIARVVHWRTADRVRDMNCGTGDWVCELSRIADALNGFDWNSFAATLLATLIGAGVAAAVSFWLAARERPKPMWRTERPDLSSWNLHAGKVGVPIRVVNIGNGTGHNVRLTVIREDEALPAATNALVHPGNTISTSIWIPASGEMQYDPYGDETVDTRTAEWPEEGARLKVEWQQPPRLNRVRSIVMQLEPPADPNF